MHANVCLAFFFLISRGAPSAASNPLELIPSVLPIAPRQNVRKLQPDLSSTSNTVAAAAGAGGLLGLCGALGVYQWKRREGSDNSANEEDDIPPSPSTFQVALSSIYNESFNDHGPQSGLSRTSDSNANSDVSNSIVNSDTSSYEAVQL